MNGFSSADMSTAEANGFRDGLAAQPAAAQETVRQPDGYHYRYGSYIRKNNGEEVNGSKPVEAVPYWYAPVAAAPVVDVAILRALADRWATDRSYTGSPVDDIRALIEQPTISTPASSADSAVLTNPYTGQPRDYRDVESDPAGTLIVEPGKPLEAASTPAAPGIDLAQFKDLIGFAAWSAINLPEIDPRRDFIRQASELLALIDASPKGVINPEWSLHDRVEFALRDAGFDLDEAAFVAEAASVANGDLDSPKGGSTSDCPIIRLAPGEYTDWEKRVWRRGVIECATQPDIAAAMQATSAEVGE